MDSTHERLAQLLATQPLAVLSTSDGGAPYSSLVAIAAEGRTPVYFATTRATHKFQNLSADPRVALLVDDRTSDVADFHAAAAATGVGVVTECAGHDAENGRRLLTERHPHLTDFLASPSTAILRADVEKWYVVTRFQAVDCVECAEDVS